MNTKQLAFKIYEQLDATNSRWSIGGELAKPTYQDVLTVLDRLVAMVYDGEEGQEAQTGGIIVRKQYGCLDVYTHIGEIDDTN